MVSHTNKSCTIGAETVLNEFGDILDHLTRSYLIVGQGKREREAET